jgi:hypothetical protein
LESVHETKDEIRHKAMQTALSFLFSANISLSTLDTVINFFFRMLWGMGIPILECQRCKLEVGAEHK